MFDFVRFSPPKIDLGFSGFVVLSENPPKEGYYGYIVKAENPKQLREKLKGYGNSIVAVECSTGLCKEAVMRKKVDIILDSEKRELDYATIKLAKEKDVAIEFGLSKFLVSKGLKRSLLFARLRQEARVVKKFDTPFILTSSAENIYQLRSRKQIETFFAYFGFDVKKGNFFAERLIRRYYDKKYIMDGFEIEQ
ncbi:MAG: RNase P subunit p30 family protein [Archaeoglobales archaeon]|nr:RNase P subunit p30 family protein [Archaeoglobales archaeon]